MTLVSEFDLNIRISISMEPLGICTAADAEHSGNGAGAGGIEGGLGPDIKIPFASPKNFDGCLSVVLP